MWYFLLVVFRYASLYFCCAIEQNDNELLCLEIIHRYVELLDKYFGSVILIRLFLKFSFFILIFIIYLIIKLFLHCQFELK